MEAIGRDSATIVSISCSFIKSAGQPTPLGGSAAYLVL